MKIGDTVEATPKDGDFKNEFVGTILGFRGDFIQVIDQDDEVFECEESQLKLVKDL